MKSSFPAWSSFSSVILYPNRLLNPTARLFNLGLSLSVKYYFWIRPVTAILAYQQIALIGSNAIASVRSQYFHLIAPINIFIIKQFCMLSIRKHIFHIYIETVQQVHIRYPQIPNPQRIYLF